MFSFLQFLRHAAQEISGIPQTIQRGKGRSVMLLRQMAGTFQSIKRYKSGFFQFTVAPDRFPQFFRRGGHIKDVIYDLKYEPQFRRIGCKGMLGESGGACYQSAQLRRGADQRAGLVRVQRKQLPLRRFLRFVRLSSSWP